MSNIYRAPSKDEETADSKVELLQHGTLTLPKMRALMEPGALDPNAVAGRRVRWAYSAMRSESADAKRVADELKQFHLQMGAYEVLVHRAPWAKEETE